MIFETFAHLSHWQIDGIATLLLLQGAVVAVFPEEVVISSLGVLWGRGKLSFIECLFSVQLGLLPANLALVWVGGRFGTEILRRRPVRWLINAEGVARALVRFNQAGAWVIAVTRFTPVIRGPVYFASGLSGISISRFFRIDALASFFQISLLLWIGHRIGKDATSLLDAYRKLGVILGLLIIGTVILITARKSRAGRAHKKPISPSGPARIVCS